MRPLIICEAGVNHGGSLYSALDLVDAAKAAGADIVKFQTYQPDKLVRRSDPSYETLAKLALPLKAFLQIAAHCDTVGIEFCSTPGDVESLDFLVCECKVKRIKIGSDDLTNKPLLHAAYATKLPVILSTGMATMDEIAIAIDGYRDVTLMQCTSLYPCPPDLVNLRAMVTLRDRFHLPVGYSDHTAGHYACTIAAALGASVIEKHLMLFGVDSADYDVSIHPAIFLRMVDEIDHILRMIGDGRKEPGERERDQAKRLRKGPDGLRENN